MKIGIDISQSVYHGAGVAVYTKNLVTSLLTVDQKNSYVLFGSALRRQEDLFNFIKSLPKTVSFSTKIFSLPPTVLAFIWNQMHAFSIESFVGNIDLFHTSDWTEPPAKATKVTTIHDLVVFKYPEFLNQRIIDTQKRKLHWVAKETRAIIADSQSTKEDIVHYLHIPADKIHVVYLGVNSEFFPQKIDLVKKITEKYGLVSPYFLCVGTREPRKNLGRVVEAFHTLNQNEASLVIVGKAGWGEDIKIGKQVRILEQISDAELAVLYTGAVGFVYPSLYEGFGLPVLEAMACGSPVITSNRGSLKEITGKNAVVVDPESVSKIAEAMEYLLELPSTKRSSMIDDGLKHAQKFTWKKTAKETLTVYEGLL